MGSDPFCNEVHALGLEDCGTTCQAMLVQREQFQQQCVGSLGAAYMGFEAERKQAITDAYHKHRLAAAKQIEQMLRGQLRQEAKP